MSAPPYVGPSRRQVLAGLGTAVAAASTGCLGRLRSIFGWQASGKVALQINTVPDDTDPYALRLARELRDWFQATGIDTNVVPMGAKELRQTVLLQHDFDIFVGRIPNPIREPDSLYALLHSTGVSSPGWQNPFGYANLRVDDLLEQQRRTTGAERLRAVENIQRSVARTQPFSLIAFPEDVRAARSDRYRNWADVDLESPLGFMGLERTGDDDVEDPQVLRVVATNDRVVGNLNPLAVEFRSRGPFTELLYDPLGREYDGEVNPWLAQSWEFEERAEGLGLQVRLRPGLEWHDQEPLTAEDVRFTYDFLADTNGENTESVIPVPRYQNHMGVVRDVRIRGGRRLDIQFTDCSRTVAKQALTVPVLPAHVWRERRQPATVGGVTVSDLVTEALVTSNTPTIGSGPLQFQGNPSGRLLLTRYDEHFLHDGRSLSLPDAITDGVDFRRLVVRVAVSDLTAVASVADGSVDATVSALGVDAIPRIDAEGHIEKLVEPSESFYFVGYNARRSPLTNPRFRNLLGRLIDEDHQVDSVFDGAARPAASPLDGTDWLPTDLEWTDGDPMTPFFGSDGELDEEQAKQALRTAGYQFNDGQVVRR
jgi:peptide/nickel transport system substrate-binding protein